MKDMPIKIVGKATSGDEAVDKIIGLEPDIVFIDIQMPIYNGLEVIEKHLIYLKNKLCSNNCI